MQHIEKALARARHWRVGQTIECFYPDGYYDHGVIVEKFKKRVTISKAFDWGSHVETISASYSIKELVINGWRLKITKKEVAQKWL